MNDETEIKAKALSGEQLLYKKSFLSLLQINIQFNSFEIELKLIESRDFRLVPINLGLEVRGKT